MDEEVARTLGELERKLHELEQALSALGSTVRAGEQPSEPRDLAREHHELAPEPRELAPEPREPSGRPRDDAWEPREPAPQARESAVSTQAPPEPRDGLGGGRIVDERIESASSAEPSTEPEPASAPGVPGAWSAAQASTPAQAWSAGLQRPDPAPSRAPQAAGAGAPPSAAELLRFRERLEQAAWELTHEYDELLGRLSYAAVPATTGPTISFARGAPSLDIIDVDGLRDASVRAFESDPAGTTAYGTSLGYPRLRSWIADRHGVEPERVLVTNGSMQADAFLFKHLVRPGDDVIVERPSYDRTLLSLRQRGARLHAVELQPDGIDTDALGRMLGGGLGARPTLAHIIPNFQNPAGYTLSLAKRQALLELAAEHDFIVFEDDPYVALRFTGETLPTMLSMDPEHVVYASSFSKTVCPGIRVGYLVGPPDLIGAIAQLATNTYISPNMVAQSIVYEFCASGAIERSIETVKAALAERADALADALRRELPEAEFVPPQGGYFMWVTLPPGTDVAALHHAAAERGVSFVNGTDFMLDGGENTLRLAFSGVTPEQIETGVARLAEAFRSL
ncbi:MAG: 2-aminoadipate transaminase [Solirubrobacteraceae bacterium]|jgi:DNA-binding transcriptional MocR family regulator|nr:2-aminoadipate transaminase [Solirubrobacteraceae bacterium]